MSIREKANSQSNPLTSGNRALELFTDRNEFTCLFARYLNEDPAPEKILFFHGSGGNGKTLLLEYLRQNCCKHFQRDIWRQISPKMGQFKAEAAEAIASTTDQKLIKPIPAIIHDFGLPPIDNNRPQDPLYGLLMLHRNLAREANKYGYQLKFPLFDFACFWYFRSVGKSDEEIKHLFSSDELDFVIQLIDGIAGIPWVSLAKTSLQILIEYIGVEEKLQYRGIDERKVAAIQGMDAERELIFQLPEFLAADLNAEMAKPKAPHRLVLFFDTHEKFWGENRDSQGETYFYRDQWLRNFLCTLEFNLGIVVVVAGRDPPKWAKATKHNIPEDYIDLRLVRYFTIADARVYLDKAGIITREKLAEAMIDYASVSYDQIHPLLLSLCVEVVKSAENKQVILTPADFSSQAIIENKIKELIERLLEDVDRKIAYAVHALCACRAFNYQVYQYLGQALNFSAMQPNFDLLREFSFVWQHEERGESWYRIHDLLRCLHRENSSEITLQAHNALRTYWQERQNIAEAIYHLNCLDWEQGLNAWDEVFEESLRLSRYDLCRALLEVRSQLDIGSDQWLGYISYWEGKYFAQLGLHSEAKREFTEAIAAYDRALTLAPDDINTLNNQGLTLKNLGDLQTGLAQHTEAVNSYRRAIATYDQALTLAPDDINTLNNQGMALQSLGDLQAGLAYHPEAVNSYRRAIATYDQALTLAPDDINTLNNQGMVLKNLGDLQAGLAYHPEAVDSYRRAIAAYDQALTLAPDDINTLNNQGLVLKNLGDLQARLDYHAEAVKNYRRAIATYDRALTLAPDDINTLNNKGVALSNLGNLYDELS